MSTASVPMVMSASVVTGGSSQARRQAAPATAQLIDQGGVGQADSGRLGLSPGAVVGQPLLDVSCVFAEPDPFGFWLVVPARRIV